MPAMELARTLAEARSGPEVQEIFQALAIRKAEVLPVVKERLRTGAMFEKFMLTKFLRYCSWPEAMPELVALARDTTQGWMPRQGALYTLAALGDKAAGPEVAPILQEPDCPAGVQLVTIAALARMQYREAADVIRPFTQHRDIHLRLFALRALAEFGDPVDTAVLLAALQDSDYVVRLEACGALGAAGMVGQLASVAANDPHEAVRAAAAQALLEHELKGHTTATKLAILQEALPHADRLTAMWIVRAMLEQGGDAGRAAVAELATRDDRLGERSQAYLILAASK